jgi:hypothetical protein
MVTDGSLTTATNGINWQISESGGYVLGVENTASAGHGLLIDAGDNSGSDAILANFVSSNNSLLLLRENGYLGFKTDNPASHISNSPTLSSDGTRTTSLDGLNWRISDEGYALGIENTAGNGGGLLVDAGNNSGFGSTVAHFVSNNVSLMVIEENGNVGIGTFTPSQRFTVYNGSTTGTYTTSGWQHSSDERLKTNVTQINNALDKVMDMEGVYFNWKKSDENRQVGMIAQEVEKVLPEVVSTDKEGYYSMSYGAVVPVLIEAIKEQQNTIENLEKSIEDLKATIADNRLAE